MAKVPAKIRKDDDYKVLLAALGDEDKALAAFSAIRENAEAEPAPVVTLVKETSKDKADKLREAQGFDYAKGRVYANGALAEAVVRVLRSGAPEIVQSSGVGRTKAVLVYKDEKTGDAVQQNLTK